MSKILKLFRDKEAWKQNEAAFEDAKKNFEAEAERRKQLAAEAGLEASRVELKFNKHIDAKLFYPEFDCEAPEYVAWRNGYAEKDCLNSTQESLEESDRDCGWPTEVLEEMALFNKHRIFEKWDHLNCRAGSERFRCRLLYGFRGRKRYLVAWWGEKEVYDEIQRKLEELRNPPAKEAAQKVSEALVVSEDASATSKVWEGLKVAIAAVVIVGLSMIAGEYAIRKTSEQPASAEVSNTSNTSNSSSVESLIIIKTEEEKIYCWIGFWQIDSLDSLPSGVVIEKRRVICPDHGETMTIVIRTSDHVDSRERVTEKVYRQLKVGDKVPFSIVEY